MKLINADELVEILDEEYRKDKSNVWKYLLINLVKQILSDAPTVDAEPVTHGHWISNSYDDNACSVCGWQVWVNTNNYCPCCGAKMDEVTKNELHS